MKLDYRATLFGLTIFLLPAISLATIDHSITLSQAEQAALTQSPELKALNAHKNALEQESVAASQLSDPKLIISAMNFPVDTFSFDQEPMTQVSVGLQQSFPRGHSLHYQSKQKQALAQGQSKKFQATRIEILREVRLSWLNLYYWLQAKSIIQQQKKIFHHLVNVTKSMLANNKSQQKDVIRAQLELTDLDNKLINVQQHLVIARADLARWVGDKLATNATPSHLPKWVNPPNLITFKQNIMHHPEIQADSAMITASQAKVKWAEQQFKPGFGIGMAYGFRGGHNADGTSRPDFLTAQVTVDLPIFPGSRQSPELKASENNLVGSEESQLTHYRQLTKNLEADYGAWKNLSESAKLYQQRLIPQANQYTQATLISYQNNQTDFPTLARSYLIALNDKLAGLNATVEREKARANLFYLQGMT